MVSFLLLVVYLLICVSGMIVSINGEDLGMLQKIESLQANLEGDDEMISELTSLAYLEEENCHGFEME